MKTSTNGNTTPLTTWDRIEICTKGKFGIRMTPAPATLGVVVIGQAPRPEIEAELRLVLGEALPIALVGALDGLSRAEIDRLTPRDSDDTLFTKLPDGDGVVISKAAVARHAQAHLDRFADQGIDVTMMCCTGVSR